MTLITNRPTESPAQHQRWHRPGLARLGAAATTTLTVAAVWALLTLGAGQTIHAPTFNDAAPAEIGIGAVIAATAGSTVIGLALLTALERWTPRARSIWTITAIAFAVMSLLGPLSGTGVTASERAALAACHVLVAVIYLPLVRRTIDD